MKVAKGRRSLSIGMTAILLLVVVASGVSVSDARGARSEVEALVHEAEDALALVGRIGRALAQERSIVLEALTEPASASAQAAGSLGRIEAQLSEDLAVLEQRLSPEERESWERVQDDLRRVRDDLATSLEEIAGGQPALAEQRLDAGIAAVVRISRALDELADRNEIEAKVLFAGTRSRLDRLVWMQVAMATALLLAIVIVIASVERFVVEYLKQVEQSNRDLDSFAGRVAHDVRNAIAPLSTAGEILRASQDPALVTLVAQRLAKSTDRALAVLESLLAFSRLRERRHGAESQPARVCAAVLDELAPLARDVGARVEHDVAPAYVGLHDDLLYVVLSNVIGNAIKFLEGRAQRCVWIRGAVRSGAYALEVEDTGPGIPAHAIDLVFEPFYRAPDARAGGTGIGLATVRRIVDAHGGEIALRSCVGEGTKVQVRLPLARCRNAASVLRNVDDSGRARSDTTAPARPAVPRRCDVDARS